MSEAGGPRSPPAPTRPSRTAPIALFLLVVAAIGAAAAFAYVAGAREVRLQEERELATVASLKVQEISRWRDERLNSVAELAADLAWDVAEGSDAAAALERRFAALRGHRSEYPALAFVGYGEEPVVAVGAPAAEFHEKAMLAFARHVATERRTVMSPVHRHAGDAVFHVNVGAPVVTNDGRLRGAALVRVDPFAQLFPMLRSWPRPSASAETWLVESDGDRAVVVNPTRSGEGPMGLRIPFDRADHPAVIAATGTRGVVEGRDHDGARVLAAIAPVADSPWTLVAKVELADALAPLGVIRVVIAVVAAALTLAAGAGAALWWKTQAGAFERARAAGDAERRLLARRLETLSRYGSDMLLLTDEEAHLLEVNDRASELLGYSREELLGMTVRDLRDPETLGDFEARRREQVERGAALFETRLRRKDGATFPVEVSVHVDEYAGRKYFQAVVRDITARERADAALRASEAKFRAAFEFASLGIVIVTPDGRILETNRALRRMLGYAEEEVRGLSVRDLHEPGDELAVSILEEMRQGTRESIETPRRFRRKDGSPVETILRASALRDDAGALRFSLGVVEDVTEKKQLEAQLVLADRMASIGTLAAGVGHEINNPLSFILSNLEYALAESGGADPEIRRALSDALDGAVRVREIVRDLRTFSRPGDDRRCALDPRFVLQSAIGLAANEIRHRARLVVDPGEVPPVVASEHRLGQVLLNLLINAAQAIPEGRADQNVVRAATFTTADGSAVVEISDTGGGIPPDVLPRIFDPFFTTKPVGVGTGLGLSICHGIVSQLGGRIAVESELGKGSTFRVVLPPAPEAERAGPAGPAAVPSAAPGGPPARGRVLVVDDEILVTRAIARMLAPVHEVVVRSSAAAALQLLATDARFDVLLCDLMMPEMTGMELHDRLAATAPALAERMIFLTGGAFTEAARAFLDRVPNERLEKPFDRASLRAAVARALAERATTAA